MKTEQRLISLMERKGNENFLHVLSQELRRDEITLDTHNSWQSVQKWSQNRTDQPIFLLLDDLENWNKLKKTLTACRSVRIFCADTELPADTKNIHFRAISPMETPEIAVESIREAILAAAPVVDQEVFTKMEEPLAVEGREKPDKVVPLVREPVLKQEAEPTAELLDATATSTRDSLREETSMSKRKGKGPSWLKRQVPWIPSFVTGSVLIALLYFFLSFWAQVYGMLHLASTGEWPAVLNWLNDGNREHELLHTVLVLAFLSIGFDVATRTKLLSRYWIRSISLLLLFGTIFGAFALFGVRLVHERLVPAVANLMADSPWTPLFSDDLRFGGGLDFEALLLTVPLMFLFLLAALLVSEYWKADEEFKKGFREYSYRNGRFAPWLQAFSRLEEDRSQPDVMLGTSLTTGEKVLIPGGSKTLNTLIVGGIGTGKTATGALNILNQDMHSMSKFINAYPFIRKREDFWSAKVAGRHLNGITVIEPTNDLCQKTLQLAEAHGIPKEAVTYLNPQDPNTPSLNPMLGPVEEVAEMFTQVIAGLDDSGSGGNFFFAQAQRSHLKQHIYLLKLHDPEKKPTLGVLVKMYNDPGLVHDMHMALKQRILTTPVPTNRDEQNHCETLTELDRWFENCIVPMPGTRGRQAKYDPTTGKQVFIDSKAEHVHGLRNILNDMSTNTGLRRVLFGDSAFDFDRHLAEGGLLLVNTAKGQLNKLSGVFGKLVLMSLQAASYRRNPDVSPLHSLMVDEFPDYLYEDYQSFPTQSRKYKLGITNIVQTTSQLASRYGEHYMTTLLAGMRNRIIYSDVPAYDAEYFSRQFGEKVSYEERVTETETPLFGSSETALGVSRSFSRKREEAVRPSELIYQDVLTCTVKLVYGNKTMPVDRIKVDYLPKEAFIHATHQVDPQAAAYWLRESGIADAAAKTRQLATGKLLADKLEEAEGVENEVSSHKREKTWVSQLTIPYVEPEADQPESAIADDYTESRLTEIHETFLDSLQAELTSPKSVKSTGPSNKIEKEKTEGRGE